MSQKDELHDLRKWAETSWQRGFQQGLESNRLLAKQATDALRKEREAHAETNRAMTEAVLVMEEREQRDEALRAPAAFACAVPASGGLAEQKYSANAIS